MAQWLGDDVQSTGKEGVLHKDWAMTPSEGCRDVGVRYLQGVADHRIVLVCLVLWMGAVDSSVQCHKLVDMRGWGHDQKRQYGDLMEAMSVPGVRPACWLLLMREVMAAISEAQHRTQADEQVWDRLKQRVDDMESSKDLVGWLSAEVFRQAWRRMVREKQLLTDGLLTGEVMRTIKMRKPFLINPLREVWDLEQERVVRGDEVLTTVAREVAKRHPPPPGEMQEVRTEKVVPPPIMEVAATQKSIVERKRARVAERVSHGTVAYGIGYPYGVVESARLLASVTSNTMTMDGFAAQLQNHLVLRGLMAFAAVLTAGYMALPPECFAAVHHPPRKPGKRGLDVNKVTRPVLVESGVIRTMQRGHWRKVQPMLSSAALQHFHHAAIKGANGNNLRRLLHAVMMQHVVRGLTFIVLLMDQSNAYGQVNRVAMPTIVREEPLLMWAWFQAAFLYSGLVVYVHTPLGLTKGYRLARGSIQGGGGMDPFWHIWFACLLAVWFRTRVRGVSAWTRHGAEMMGPQATMDGTVILASEMRLLEVEANAAVEQAGRMNLVNNPDKFGLVHLSKDADGVMGPVRGSIQVGGERVKAKGTRTYIKLLGGDINWFSEAMKDKVQLASKCKQLLGRMRFHVPGLVLMRVLVQGILINAWTHTKIVKMPVHCLAWIADKHQVAAATASVANVVRKVLRLPYKTPWRFIFGALREGGLAVPHPARCLWVRFVAEMYDAMCSVHPLKKRGTRWEVQCGGAEGTLADDLGTDFDKLARWGTANGWDVLYRRGPDTGDRWECGPDLSGVPHGLLLLVGDATADEAPLV